MQNIHRAILSNLNTPVAQSRTFDIQFSKFQIVHMWYEQFLAFVGESICQGETALFVSRLTMLFRS